MRVGIPILAVLLAACDSPTTSGGDLLLSRGPCHLTGFEYLDRTFNMRVGPELRGSFIISTITPGDSLHGWVGESNGLQGQRTALDGSPSSSPLAWSNVVAAGSYTGTLKVQGDSVRWSFDDDRASVVWMSYQPWRLEGQRMLARWGDFDRLGWSLAAEVTCPT